MSVFGLFPQLDQWGTMVACVIAAGMLLTHRHVFRIPLLIFFHVLLAIDLVLYIGVRLVVRACEMLATARLSSRQRLHKLMKRASTYEQWAAHATKLDESERRTHWKERAEDPGYDHRVVRAAVSKLRSARERGSAAAIREAVEPCLVKNFGGVMNHDMYIKLHCGTKGLIEEFISELEACLQQLATLASQADNGPDEKAMLRTFAQSAVQSYGKTSLLLSGGAHFGFYHFGLLRALLAADMLPNIICGTSMGSIVLSFLTSRSNEEALHELRELDELYRRCGPDGPMRGSKLWKLWRIITHGYIYESEEMEKHMEWFTRGMTFQEAFEKHGRAINITCTPFKTRTVKGLPPILLNHLTAPRVTITSAVLASSCVPFLIPPVVLMEKVDGVLRPYQGTVCEDGPTSGDVASSPRATPLSVVQMRDGSFESDVPVHAMGSFFNSHFSIVSQVNPHIVQFYFNPEGAIGRPIRWPWRTYRGGFLATLLVNWCKEHMLMLLKVMKSVNLLFNVLGVDWGYLFLQEGSQGDLTIVPNVGLRDYYHVVDNLPSREDLDEKIRQSERATWRHFTIIRHRLRIERAVEALQRSASSSP